MEQPLGHGSMIGGFILLALFPVVESKVENPMFRLDLFKIKMFSYANVAGFLSSLSRGGMMFMLILLLQGIWLPLHGYSYESTPFCWSLHVTPHPGSDNNGTHLGNTLR
nr:hypothetical protein [Methanobacterium formicicum]